MLCARRGRRQNNPERTAWDTQVTSRSVHDEFWDAVTEHPSTSERLWKGWQHLEQATTKIDKYALGFGFPVERMMMKHYKSSPEPAWWEEVNEHYTQLLIELYRAHSASTSPRGRSLMLYYAKRATYVTEYLAAAKALREAAVAWKKGDMEQAIEHMEVALEQTYNCMTTLADVARDQSDRGLIAVLNAYAYQPLKREYERLVDEEDSRQ